MRETVQHMLHGRQKEHNFKIFQLLDDRGATKFISIIIARGIVAVAVLLAANQFREGDGAKDDASARADAAGYSGTRFDWIAVRPE